MKESRFEPDYVAYVWLLEIALKVLTSPVNDERRIEVVTSIFEQCCKEGMLSGKFARVLSSTLKPEICKQLFGDLPLPTAWSRNLRNAQEQQPKAVDLVRKTESSNKGHKDTNRRQKIGSKKTEMQKV